MAIGGDPITAAVGRWPANAVCLSGIAEEAKAHGRGRDGRASGTRSTRSHLEDVVTTGGSSLQAIDGRKRSGSKSIA
jgi:orotate phosphoribosyltransferase